MFSPGFGHLSRMLGQKAIRRIAGACWRGQRLRKAE